MPLIDMPLIDLHAWYGLVSHIVKHLDCICCDSINHHWFRGLVGHDFSLTPRRSPVRARAKPIFLAFYTFFFMANGRRIENFCLPNVYHLILLLVEYKNCIMPHRLIYHLWTHTSML